MADKDANVLNALYRFLLVLVVIAAVIVGVATFMPQMAKLSELRRQDDILKIKVREQEELLAQQQKIIHLLENDPEYVEIVARDKLGAMKPGETIFRITSATAE